MESVSTEKLQQSIFGPKESIDPGVVAKIKEEDLPYPCDDPYLSELIIVLEILIAKETIDSAVGFKALVYQHLIGRERDFIDWKHGKDLFCDNVDFQILLSKALVLYPKNMHSQDPDIMEYIRDYNKFCLGKLAKPAA